MNREKLKISFLSSCLGKDVNAIHLEDVHFKDKIVDKIVREGLKGIYYNIPKIIIMHKSI